MRSNTGYFQFPLCLLAFGSDYKDRLQHIVSYCVCERAQRLSHSFMASDDPGMDRGASFLKVNIGSREATIDRWQSATRFIEIWEERHGRDALVRIATKLLWEAHNDTGLSYREFSLLCAINSIIGYRRFRPIRITEDSIRVRAAGYKSWTVAHREVACDKSRRGQVLTKHEVRYALERLHQRGLFARARVGAKTVKYMVGGSDADLRKLLLQTETRRSQFRAERARKDQQLMIMIRSRNQMTYRRPRNPE
jgi:hypothetical protein